MEIPCFAGRTVNAVLQFLLLEEFMYMALRSAAMNQSVVWYGMV